MDKKTIQYGTSVAPLAPALVYYTEAVHQFLVQSSFHTKLAYFETDYFGGAGVQAGLLYENGRLRIPPRSGEGTINLLLKELGVWHAQGRGEFDALQLAHHRRMPDCSAAPGKISQKPSLDGVFFQVYNSCIERFGGEPPEERGPIMKRFLTLLLTTLLLTAALCVTASASSFDDAAQELSAIGMLRGSAADGLGLDNAPTRTQAAIMLVRLYGAEEEAVAAYTAGELECPFTDVNAASAPFAAWLADKGLASGTSATTFGGSNPCTVKAYTIFLLRALGYEDNVDFTTASAQAFAASLGLMDTSVFTGRFLRDDLAAMTYQALGVDLKDGSTYLLDSLIKSGAVDAEAAKPITDKIEAYRALQAAGQDMAEGLDASIDAKMAMDISMKGQSGGTDFSMSTKLDAAVTGSIQMVLDQEPQMAMEMTVTMTDDGKTETESVAYWLKDGVVYVRSGELSYQMPAGVDFSDYTALMEQSAGKVSPALLPFIEKIDVKSSGGDTVYTLTLNSAFAGLMDGIIKMALQELPEELAMDFQFSLDNTSIRYTAGQDGKLKSAAIVMTLKAGVKADADASGSTDVSVAVDLDMNMDIKATGKDVKISFPDFSGFAPLMDGVGGSD